MHYINRILLPAFACIALIACGPQERDRSGELSAYLKSNGVSFTNVVPSVVCQNVAVHKDQNGFVIWVEHGDFKQVNLFLQTVLGDHGIGLGKDVDGFDDAVFHKTRLRPGFMLHASTNGVQIIGIK
jgi:hypothetical protein